MDGRKMKFWTSRWVLLVGLISVSAAAILFTNVRSTKGVASSVSENADSYATTPINRGRLDENPERKSEEQEHEADLESAVDRKLDQRSKNAEIRTGMTEEELKRGEEFALDTFYDPASRDEFLNKLHAELSDILGEEEADFRVAVIRAAEDWAAVKALIRDREATLSNEHSLDWMLMEVGVDTGQISVSEVQELASRGVAIPDDAVYQLASHGNAEAVGELLQTGLIGDPNFEDPVLGENAIGAYVRHASNYPSKRGNEEWRIGLETLIHSGVSIHSSNGSFDALDTALQYVNRSNVDVKIKMIEVLLSNGAAVGDSHVEMLNRIKDDSVRRQIQEKLNNFL